jgi:cellulose synthase/poly-beta-1,6-N-acetylglucosamine synthase-like glycosyltransferase
MLETIEPVVFILLGILTLALFVQLYYLFGIFGKLSFYKPTPSNKSSFEPLSVIIAARNESENLQNNLRSILEQDYPNFEVVVVNDCSWDDSQKVLEELQQEYKHLHVSQLFEQEKYPTGKKFAVTIGIKSAKNDLLVFTDADCIPKSNQWLRHIQSRFEGNKEIVLGYSPYNKEGGFLNLYIRFETFMTALFYMSMALMKNPFMGVGRNLAYRKDLFFRHKGFANHQHILSGDDDLFINEAATSNNVAIEINEESFVGTEPKKDFDSWNRQKSRHMTTGKFYKSKHKQTLGIYYMSLMLFYGALTATLILNIQTWPIVVGIYLLRLISQEIVFYLAAKNLKCTSILFALPILDLLYVFYLLVFGTKGLFAKNKREW